ncbi:MAG: dihydrofolate reductase family protein [Variibacter sp.]|nr:dihydrofolate reductase family protein [Variibacter sp.]
MRELISQSQFSLDGFVGGPNGEREWVFPGVDAEVTEWIVQRLWEARAHLVGRVTYQDMATHWPSSTEPYAPSMNRIPKVVFSTSRKRADWAETRLASGDLARETLKQEPGRDLLAHEAARFARALIASGTVDAYRLIVPPVVLGRGPRILDEVGASRRLRVADATIFKTGVFAKTFYP